MLKRRFPILDWLPKYRKAYLYGDLTAGFTVGVMLIPQGMAYAMIAGLPPVFGLYAALIPQVVYALMGTSRQLAIGPVAMDSILVASGLGTLSIVGIENYISMAIFLALFMGAIQITLGVLKMGFLVNFLSRPVISGFTSAAALIIGFSQLKHLLGIPIVGNKIYLVIKETFLNLGDINPYAVLIGVAAIAIMIVAKRYSPGFPAAILVVVLGILLVYFTNVEYEGLDIVGTIPQGLPSLKIPYVSLNQVGELFPIAIALALIGFMEAISIGKSIEEKVNGYEINPNQELLALGSANVIGSFFQSYSVTSSFSRTAVNFQSGAKTGIAALVSVLIVGLTLLFLTPLFYYLPNTILAAIIMVALYNLIDIEYPKELYRHQRDEFVLLLATFFITLLVGIKEGILLGVLFSLLLMVYRTSKPHIAILGRIKGTDYFKNINRFTKDIEDRKDMLVIRFDAQLFFGNKDYFKSEIYKYVRAKGKDLKVLIINAEAINYLDSSALHLIRQIIIDLNSRGIRVMVAGANGPSRDILFKTGVADLLGRENLSVRTYEAADYYDGLQTRSEIQEKVSQQNS